MASKRVRPQIRAAVLAALHAGEQPAIVAARYGVDGALVRMWKTRYVTRDVAPVAPLLQPSVEAQKAHIGELVLDLLRSKLEASQALAEAVRDPTWIRRQPASELAALGQWLDATAMAIGDRLAGASGDAEGPEE